MVRNAEYDYVIAGGGSAGCVLANRLSADPGTRVLLIEAGPRDRSPWIHVPGGIFKLIHNPALDWCYETEPEPGLDGRIMAWPRGKVLGGSSSINGMVYVRGQREDFDSWRDQGNAGWSYDEVLPYFRRSEDQGRGADAFHGVGGPLAVSDPRFKLPIVDAFVEAAIQAGYPRAADFNGATQEGAGYFQLNVRNGRRCSTARAFLRPAMGRPNLDVVTGARVHRLVFEGRRAVGLEYSRRGSMTTVRARREVILCAGTIGSAQILQLSGVGAPEELEPHGIKVVHALPGVGHNLQDHFQIKAVFKTKQSVTLNRKTHSVLGRVLIGADYVFRRRGVLSFGASLAGAFLKTDPGLARPDIQFHFQPLSLDRYDQGLHTFSAFTMSACQLQPRSRGSITLRSANPEDRPIIRANYLTDPEDGRILVEGLRAARRIAEAPALAGQISSEWMPGSELESDAQMLDYIRRVGSTVFHPVGTCRMGLGPDAVVDPSLRVYGIDGLRVADDSIMPTIVSGNTNAAAVMIGEKAADMLLAGL